MFCFLVFSDSIEILLYKMGKNSGNLFTGIIAVADCKRQKNSVFRYDTLIFVDCNKMLKKKTHNSNGR